MNLKEVIEQEIRNLAFLVVQGLGDHMEGKGLKQVLRDLEKEVILNAMVVFEDNQSEAARYLGISRQSLINKLKLYANKP